MKVQFASDDGLSIIGYLQDEHISFGINNSYAAPFENVGGNEQIKTYMSTASIALTGTDIARYQWMYYQFWNGATPPEISLNIAFVAETENDDLLTKLQTLLDMFAIGSNAAGMLLPPGGLCGASIVQQLLKVINELSATTGIAEAFQSALSRINSEGASLTKSRLVNIYIGQGGSASLVIKNMLPERIEFKGVLPLMADGNFGVVLCTCVFKSFTLATKGVPFIERG